MATIKFGNIIIETDDPEEAAALVLKLNSSDVASRLPDPPKSEKKQELPAIGKDAIRGALKFLRLVKDKPAGTKVDEIQTALGVATPKGIGPKMTMINYILEILALPQDTVYINPKGPNGRIWYPKKNIGEAINMLETVLSN
jgi:hypothetical protein